MGGVFFELTILVCVAALLSIVFKIFKQPAILAYIFAGILIGPFGQVQLTSHEELRSFAQLGVTLLLFMLGLELKFKDLQSIGPTAFKVGIAQILITAGLAYSLSIGLGFSSVSSLFVSIALTFASTIITIKLLSDKRDLSSLYGKISLGVLLVQDFVAIIILILLSAVNSTGASSLSMTAILPVLLKGVLMFGAILYLSKAIFPKITHFLARSPEALFLFSLAWVFGLSAAVSSPFIGFTIEIGGFLAGLALANSLENYQIVARVRALRDFFITLFFVTLGMEMSFSSVGNLFIPIVVLLLFVIVAKPLIMMGIMGIMGYRKRTYFLAGLNSGQISEFSLIIMFLGHQLGYVTSDIVSLITIVSIITFATSTYTIMASNSLYKKIGNYFGFLENKSLSAEKHSTLASELEEIKGHIALIGANRMGKSILASLQKEGEQVIVVDFNPDVVASLRANGVLSLFGDIADIEIQERAKLHKAKMIISTVDDMEDNFLLIENLKANGTKAQIIVIAHYASDEHALYTAGADYVVMPYLVGGNHLVHLIKSDRIDETAEMRKKEIKEKEKKYKEKLAS